MKRKGVLNSGLSKTIASMGHTDKLVICDSGLPIPKNSDVIDLALTKNIPRFMDTLKVVLEELKVEEAIVTNELVQGNSKYFKEITSLLNGIKIKKVTHKKFKEITRNGGNVTFVRTGEATPYANVILISGVTF